MNTPRSIALVLTLALAACGGSDPGPPESGGGDAGHAKLKKLWSETAPEGAVDVTTLRQLEDGADVVVRGEVREFKLPGKAQFWIADHSLENCTETGDADSCETPWDFCCADPEALALGTATVELHEGGKLIASDVQGFHGIDHLTDVVVAGKLSIDEAGNLLVVADKLHAEK